MATERYDIGEASFTELLIAQRMYLKISLSLVDADTQIWAVVTAFEQLMVNGSTDSVPNAAFSETATR